MGSWLKRRKFRCTCVLAVLVSLCLACQADFPAWSSLQVGTSETVQEVVQLNERLRSELSALNSDYDRMRNLQRWMFVLVGIGALSLGFVLGYLGRHLKATAKAS